MKVIARSARERLWETGESGNKTPIELRC
jgi:hypothetical protein